MEEPRFDRPALICGHVPAGTTTLLTVIVPVYNEAATVSRLLSRVLESDCEKEVIVVDDGSNDGTSEVLSEWKANPEVLLLRHEENRGKGAAIRTGLAKACGRFVIVQDADLEYDPSQYTELLRPLLAGVADVVYGSRRMENRRREWLNPFYHGVSTLNVLTWLLYRVHLTDEATCYKVFPTDILRDMRLECERFEFCPEVTAKACRMKLRIVEVPIRYHRRNTSEGKKIRFHDWIEAVAALWRWRTWKPCGRTPPCQCGESSELSERSSRPSRRVPQ